MPPHTLAVVITQSGETADTLAALRQAKRGGAASLAICNVVGSMATRESDGTIYTHAGPEIGVASTKAFTSQLVALYLLALRLGRCEGHAVRARRAGRTSTRWRSFRCCSSGRWRCRRRSRKWRHGSTAHGLPVPGARHQLSDRARRGAKLKEISYIHAEGYPAGEMKHGPIALIDERMPVVAIAPYGAGVREDDRQHAGGQGARRIDHRGDHRDGKEKLRAILDPPTT